MLRPSKTRISSKNTGRTMARLLLLSGVFLVLCMTSAVAKGQEKDFFPGIPDIKYEGPYSRNPLAYKYYNAEEEILGGKMKDWLRFSVAFWHSFRGDGSDPFGSPTRQWPWDDGTETLETAFTRMRANFEFLKKLGVNLWCFHDRDISPEGRTLEETNEMFDQVVDLALSLQKGTDIHPLWGTAQLFKHPRYAQGAATSPDARVFAVAAAQVKKCLEVTKKLGGENYVFWGGREGYQTLLTTDLKKELDHMALFLRLAAEHKKKIGFNGTLLLEPKPQEPTKHQYDWDAATTIGFLEHYGLGDEFKLNIECNHATLAGHSCFHELEFSRINGKLGNIDANTGDAQTGWDTDQFLTDPTEAALVGLAIIRNGGLAPGGINFDAKLRRESIDVEDLFIGHISGMDALARGLRVAAKIVEDGALEKLVQKRYAGWTGLGAKIEAGTVSLEDLAKAAEQLTLDDLTFSGKEELAEVILQTFVSGPFIHEAEAQPVGSESGRTEL
ncbi:xylose isomerase [Klebsormidium nitens]|uniref:Xylose isomerase n=1 Tax=Klebsormidium nitens TaxID=105231 RepID=A0A1Y1I2W2_KLENI|nr:xylose isomerase [Klebsormidium nitens]|eukprot:GAQ82468.1 xylose isomerase [Klebsormidium nitens]